jgi:signal transduction histidine kinase/FixJ family two-component response regulator
MWDAEVQDALHSRPENGDSQTMRVLIVDDEEALCEVLSLSVADLGYETCTARSGEEALVSLDPFQPHIVLTDIKMPGIDGVELLRRIKAVNPDIEVIMISGHGDMELAIKSLQHEALDFITKPVRDELLVNALHRASERIIMRRQIREHTENLERIVKEKSARLVELERQIAVGQVVEGLSTAMNSICQAFTDPGGPAALKNESRDGDAEELYGDADGRERISQDGMGPGYFNELPCFIAVHNRYLEIVAVNALYAERIGELTGANSWEPYINREGSGNACPVWATVEEGSGRRSHETLKGADGNPIPVLVHTAPIFNKDGEVELVIELSVDVSEVSRLQEAARAAQEKFQRLFDIAPCFITVVDRDFNITEANRLYRQEFAGRDRGCCYKSLHQSEEPCTGCIAQETFLDGGSHEMETVLVGRRGEARNVLMQSAPIRDEHGNIVQVLEIGTDITQIRALQDHLTSLGLMLGSMSHGVKGLLTSLDGGVFKVEAGLRRDDPERVVQGWAVVSDKIHRIRKMVLDILYYVKSREPERLPVKLKTFAEDLHNIVGPKAKEKEVDFSLDFAIDIERFPKVAMDETAMTSAMVNFLENAVDACADRVAAESGEGAKGPKPAMRLRVEAAELEGEEAVRFIVSDNGIGMDQETLDKMFTLFFSSKGSRGTGLGLFVSNQIIQQHGGFVAVDSVLGEGSEFRVVLPIEAPEENDA